MSTRNAPQILCVDDDRDITDVVQAVLGDEGYRVACLFDQSDEALMRTVGQLEPDCILLDGGTSTGYGEGWADAAAIAIRRRAIPVIMFTAHAHLTREAREAASERAQAAHFTAVLDKPFSIDELLEAVANATGKSIPFDRSEAAERERTRELAEAIAQRGGLDIQASERREWATFSDPKGRLFQLYWWQQRGVYQLARFEETGRMQMIGQFMDRDAAIDAALPAATA